MTQPAPGAPHWEIYPGPEDAVRTGSLAPVDPARFAGRYRPSVPVAPQDSDTPRGPGYGADDPLVISAGGLASRREGVWTVPPYLRLVGGYEKVWLDFRRAQLTSRVISIQVFGGGNGIVLIVPEGWAARIDQLTQTWGAAIADVARHPVGDNPLLVLNGSTGSAPVVVRYPKRSDERRMRRQLANEQKHRR